MEPTLSGPFKGGGRFREFEYNYNGIEWVMVWNPNKVIDIGHCLICGGGRLERFTDIHIYIYIYIIRITQL